MPGLERALEGKTTGDRFEIEVAPAEGYGEHNGKESMSVHRRDVKDKVRQVREGAPFQLATSDGRQLTMWITAVRGARVTVDTNHPLAGKTLAFDVLVGPIRVASREELAHGHAHGDGGHNH